MLDLARRIDREGDAALRIATGVGPDLGLGVNRCQGKGVRIQVVLARLQGLRPDTNTADRHEQSFNAVVSGFVGLGGLARFRPRGLHRPEVDIGVDVRFHHPNKASVYLVGINQFDFPEIGIQTVGTGRENSQLRSALTSRLEEGFSVQHFVTLFPDEGICERLAGSQRLTIASVQDSDFSLRNNRLGLRGVDLIEDVHEQLKVEAGRHNTGLRPVFTVRRHNFPRCQRFTAIDPENSTQAPIRNPDDRSRGDRGYDDHNAQNSGAGFEPERVKEAEEHASGVFGPKIVAVTSFVSSIFSIRLFLPPGHSAEAEKNEANQAPKYQRTHFISICSLRLG